MVGPSNGAAIGVDLDLETNGRRSERRLPRWLGIVLYGLVATVCLFAILPDVVSRLGRTICPKSRFDITALSAAVQDYSVDHEGRLPRVLEDLLIPSPDGGAYLETLPLDPWGHPYGLELLEPVGYRVYSLGPDGQPGGGDDIESEAPPAGARTK